MVKNSPRYSPLGAVDDDEKLHGDAERSDVETRKSRSWLWLSHGVLICTSMLFFTLWIGTPSCQLCGGISICSTANVAVEPIIVKFNGTLDFPSIYHGHPSLEIDAVWDRISTNDPSFRCVPFY
ncbi:hypothetical protein AZE42_13115 [Rhizopogon vesiculosus]|uniref:Uncharacterized protein n=1 Tax=Rhizopogon vesiculosus TaxID=180088 RepID=A0A1J8Q531_9AGAM|nr:hypothetical protein AZE42_13115 [Rhizopogon vesiculosus]